MIAAAMIHKDSTHRSASAMLMPTKGVAADGAGYCVEGTSGSAALTDPPARPESRRCCWALAETIYEI